MNFEGFLFSQIYFLNIHMLKWGGMWYTGVKKWGNVDKYVDKPHFGG